MAESMDEDRLEIPPLPLSFQPDLVGEHLSPSTHGGEGHDTTSSLAAIRQPYDSITNDIEVAQFTHTEDDISDDTSDAPVHVRRPPPIPLEQQVSFSFDADLSTPDPFHAEFYITSLRSKEEFKRAGIDPKRQPYLRFGRPDVPETFARVERLCAAEGIGRVAVVCCGPSSMMESVQEECRKRGGCCGSSGCSGGVSFDLHLEEFDF